MEARSEGALQVSVAGLFEAGRGHCDEVNGVLHGTEKEVQSGSVNR